MNLIAFCLDFTHLSLKWLADHSHNIYYFIFIKKMEARNRSNNNRMN